MLKIDKLASFLSIKFSSKVRLTRNPSKDLRFADGTVGLGTYFNDGSFVSCEVEFSPTKIL